MYLLSESVISSILASLNPSEAHDFLSTLTHALTHQNEVQQPHRTSIVSNENTSLFMPVANCSTTGIKIVTVPRARPIAGVINLFSPEGQLLGLLGAAEITAFRTALASMTMYVRLADAGISRTHVVVFGAGRQAEWHARLALLLSEPGETQSIAFVNRGLSRSQTLQEEVVTALQKRYPDVNFSVLTQEGTPTDIYNNSLQGLVAKADIIFSCTPAREPNFPSTYVKETAKPRFISLIGSYKPEMQEVDTETLLSGGGRVYVDDKDSCLIESGELIRANVQKDQLVDIGEVYEGRGLEKSNKNVVFKCVGMGAMDLVTAKKMLDVAIEKGFGQAVNGFS